jgi:UDP-N-acetylglucosamine--N-acetylmuramyl-(pentapeptide) pyrophosphoryl-undecaprenol N-acetylglucosamine transferase
MKILLTGGGTGGHFYPIIAVAEQLNEVISKNKILDANIYYMGDSKYNESLLFDKGVTFLKVSTGKTRRYFSLLNFFDLFKTAWAVFTTFFVIFKLYPDVIFGKGGYVSFPALVAARILNIPVIIHESDSKPGRVNRWAGKFAQKIAVSYPQTAQYFDAKKVAYTGNPIRRDVTTALSNGAHEFLSLEEGTPTILIIGGSQGSIRINDAIIDALPELVQRVQIIHQTGKKNIDEVRRTADVALRDSQFKARYKTFDYLNNLALRMSAGASDLIISRAGSMIFEIAAWGIPSIIIPIPQNRSHDQEGNALSYAQAGACVVMEEDNLTPHVLIAEIFRLIDNEEERKKMTESAKKFSKLDAAHTIAEEIIRIAMRHER